MELEEEKGGRFHKRRRDLHRAHGSGLQTRNSITHSRSKLGGGGKALQQEKRPSARWLSVTGTIAGTLLTNIKAHIVDAWAGEVVLQVGQRALAGHDSLDEESEPAQEAAGNQSAPPSGFFGRREI